ncbi:PilZ domain-containing protein [Novosphingobium sp. 1949]|uniref:PilZ domain-containing protein n=1 Tax=Novosphingobium organovorum TaxID=2930092 RepID=A0ABT0B9U2_9SPHN|nr:PilZ domain-containing protein [Novosphingobium organovorum]MCJ2181842.1 PilZ domain-containing protein [Novosphingobium organovorum]
MEEGSGVRQFGSSGRFEEAGGYPRDDRLARRHSVFLHARCRTSPWRVFDVEIGNISAGGCSLIGVRDRFAIGAEVGLRIAHLKPLTGYVTWTGEGVVGVEFKSALSERVIRVLNESYRLDPA